VPLRSSAEAGNRGLPDQRLGTMTSAMQTALLELSSFFDPFPSVVFRRVLNVIAQFYNDTMAMVNLIDGDVIRFHEAVNPRPGMMERGSLALRLTY
jgi:hypothetical protein